MKMYNYSREELNKEPKLVHDVHNFIMALIEKENCIFIYDKDSEIHPYIKDNYPILSPYSGFLGGFIGGSCAVLVNNPLDVVKTRQQREASSIKTD